MDNNDLRTVNNMNKNELNDKLKNECVVNERSINPIVKVNRLAYMRFGRKDLNEAIEFFKDFGLTLESQTGNQAYLRTIENASHALILEESSDEYSVTGFSVKNFQELEKLARKMRVKIQSRDDALGGHFVQLVDPDKNLVEVNCGLNELSVQPHYQAAVEANTPKLKTRFNDVVRPKLAPPPIARLGHTVLAVRKFKESVHWYQDTLGFIASDFQMLEGHNIPTVGFLRCDQGDTPSDHHTLAIGSAVGVGHEHTAFEVTDIDLIAMGQKWLKHKKHHHSWGIGRHILGSQIFDYWRDPRGFQFEHYCDGDMFDNQVATEYCAFSGDSISQWGPKITKDMLGTKPGIGLLVKVFKHLFSSTDLNMKRLVSLIKVT